MYRRVCVCVCVYVCLCTCTYVCVASMTPVHVQYCTLDLFTTCHNMVMVMAADTLKADEVVLE